jgi:hypothetical protein
LSALPFLLFLPGGAALRPARAGSAARGMQGARGDRAALRAIDARQGPALLPPCEVRAEALRLGSAVGCTYVALPPDRPQ